ncbi:hypothetical protein MMC07_004223 [Pseudocyphellaria aurata]|nr:hypothetical protein [Pseudocyphellaria aurata]
MKDDYTKEDEDNNRIGFDHVLLQTPSVTQIRELAQFIEFEKTAYWHARLAEALWRNDHHEAAIQECQISLSIDEGFMLAILGLIECYEKREDHKLVIDWTLKALINWPDAQKDMKSIFWRSITYRRVQIGEVEGAIEAAKEACELDPESAFAAYIYLYALDAGSRFQEILEFAHDLEKASPATTKESVLFHTDLKGEGINLLANAAAALGRLDFVSNVIETSFAAAEGKNISDTADQLFRLGCFKFKWLRDTDESIKLWESALESTADTSNSRVWDSRSECIDQLGQVYFDRAVKSEKQGLSPGSWVSKLEILCTKVKGSEEDGDVFSSESASMVLGLWYRLHDVHDKAKDCFGPLILEAIDILTDDDPDNDVWGYVSLGSALLKAGDKANAYSAFVFTVSDLKELTDARQAMQKNQAMVSPKEDRTGNKKAPEESLGVEMNSLVIGAEPDSASAVTEIISEPVLTVETTSRKLEEDDKANDESAVPSNDFQVEQSKREISDFWYCDGDCTQKREKWTALYYCEICLDTTFCDQCLELVQADRLPFQKCSPDHTFYQIYPSAQKMDMNTVVVDGKTLLRTEWLANLRKEWEG